MKIWSLGLGKPPARHLPRRRAPSVSSGIHASPVHFCGALRSCAAWSIVENHFHALPDSRSLNRMKSVGEKSFLVEARRVDSALPFDDIDRPDRVPNRQKHQRLGPDPNVNRPLGSRLSTHRRRQPAIAPHPRIFVRDLTPGTPATPRHRVSPT